MQSCTPLKGEQAVEPFICVRSEGCGVSFLGRIGVDISARSEGLNKNESLKLTPNSGLTGFKTHHLPHYGGLEGESKDSI